MKMRGLALLGNRIAKVTSFPVGEPGPGEALIRVMSAGICGSDLHFYRDTPEGLGPRRGVVIGHEPAGVVEAVGPGVTRLAPGDRVAVNHTLGCGKCKHCISGETVLCEENVGMAQAGHGGNAEFTVMPERNCHILPDALSFQDGSFISCTGATGYGAVSKLAPRGGDTVAVFGLGPVGLSSALVAKAMGARVIGVDLIEDRRDFATSLGVDAVVDGSDAAAAIRSLTTRGAHYSVETTGSPSAQRTAVVCLRPRGKAVFVGLGPETPAIAAADFLHDEKTLLGSKVLSSPGVEALVRFMIDTGLRFEPIVTRTVSLKDAPAAFAEFADGAAGKYVILPQG